MIPYNYEIRDGVTYFKYKWSDIREWYTIGRSKGGTGFILYSIDEKGLYTYKGFGTIESATTELITIHIVPHPLFNGKPRTADEIIAQYGKKQPSIFDDAKFIMVDMSKYSKDKI